MTASDATCGKRDCRERGRSVDMSSPPFASGRTRKTQSAALPVMHTRNPGVADAVVCGLPAGGGIDPQHTLAFRAERQWFARATAMGDVAADSATDAVSKRQPRRSPRHDRPIP
jgi:hypothetical protein